MIMASNWSALLLFYSVDCTKNPRAGYSLSDFLFTCLFFSKTKIVIFSLISLINRHNFTLTLKWISISFYQVIKLTASSFIRRPFFQKPEKGVYSRTHIIFLTCLSRKKNWQLPSIKGSIFLKTRKIFLLSPRIRSNYTSRNNYN